MDSRNTLVALAVLGVSLLLAVLIDGTCRTETRPATRRVIPEFATLGPVVGLGWQRGEGARVALERDGAGAFQLVDAERAVVDQAAVRAITDALETLTFVRRYRPSTAERREFGLDRPVMTLAVDFAEGRRVTLSLGRRITATDRVWIARTATDAASEPHGAGVYLIDGYQARALDRQPRDLRQRQVFPVFHAYLDSVTLRSRTASVQIVGKPARVRLAGANPGVLAMEPQRFRALADDLAELTIDRFATSAQSDNSAPAAHLDLAISVYGAERTMDLQALGPCPGAPELSLCSTSIGVGCVSSDKLSELSARIADPRALLARTPLAGIRPAVLTIGEPGQAPTEIVAAGRSWAWASTGAGTPDIESSAVDAWLEHLERSSSGHYVWPGEHGWADAEALVATLGAPALSVEVTDANGRRLTLAVFRVSTSRPFGTAVGYLARRGSEPGFLALDRATHASALWPAGQSRFQRRQLISREPFSLRSVTVERAGRVTTRLQRGQLLDDWQVAAPAGAEVARDTIDSLRELARLRAQAFAAAAPSEEHGLRPPRVQVRLEFDPGPLDTDDNSREVRIDIGAQTTAQTTGKTTDGCYARLDGAGPVFTIDRATCTLLTQPLTGNGT